MMHHEFCESKKNIIFANGNEIIASIYFRKYGLTHLFEFKTTWEKSQKTTLLANVPRGQIQNTLKK